MNRILLVARREILANVARRSFVISLVVVLVLIIGASFFASFMMNRSAQENEVTAIGVSSELADIGPSLAAIGATLDLQIETAVVEEADASPALDEGDIRAWLGGELGNSELRFPEAPSDPVIEQVVYSAMQSFAVAAEISELGGDPVESMTAVAASMPEITFAADNEGVGTDWGKLIVSWAMIALLFMGIVMSGSLVSMGVVEEKSSRVVELLLATITPSQLFGGKILGIGVVAFSQVLLYALTAVGAASVSGLLDDVSIQLGPYIGWLVVWFLIGFAMFVVLWGGISALASRQEDVGSVTAPMIFLLLVPFYVAMYLPTNAPNSTASVITSILPFTGPFVMPVRQVFVDVPAWQVAASIGVGLLTIIVCVWIAAKVYHRGVLHTGARLTLREAFARA
ncbi:MAG TPA: ABC transporter permease [Actinomycetaceae bacterium]|nr:ABC transporter permease [Actinomycetaceae bacterium]